MKPFSNQNDSITKSDGGSKMASITIKNIPDELYTRLKKRASLNHRSINGEVIYCLEDALSPKLRSMTTEDKLDLVQRSRVKIDPEKWLTPEQLKAAIEEGRE